MYLIKIITNIELDCELKEFYVDNGDSGTSLDRLVFNRLLDDIIQGKINRIIVKDLPRLGCNHVEVNKYIDDNIIHEDKSIENNFKEDINSI